MTTDPPSTPKGESQLHAVVTGEEVGRARAAQGLRRSSKAAVRAAERPGPRTAASAVPGRPRCACTSGTNVVGFGSAVPAPVPWAAKLWDFPLIHKTF